MDSQIIAILDVVQKNTSNHQKYLKVLEKIYEKADIEEFTANILKFLEVTLFTDMERNEYVERTLDFFAKFVTLINNNENETEDSDSDSSSHPLLQSVIAETLNYHDVAKIQVRYNCCKFISLILQYIGYNTCLEGDLCDEIQETMLLRLQDPKPNVRLQAIKALVRLQEPKNPECPVVKAYILLMCDSNAAVRREIIKRIARNSATIPRIKNFTRDIDSTVRAAAFSRCADIGAKLFSIEERQAILSCGFIETNKQARQAFMENLIPKWLGAYNGDIVSFLYALKLDAKEEDFINSEVICKKVMEVLFKITPLKEILDFLPVEESKLIPYDKLTSHTVIYWALVVQYLNSSDETEEYLETIRPELTPFCNYIEQYVKKKTDRTLDTWEYTEYQYVLYNLFEMAELYDLSDEVGRQTLQRLVMSVLKNHRLEFRTLSKVMKISANFIKNVNSFANDICEIISDIHEPLIEKEPTQKNSDENEFQIARIKVKLTSLQLELESALSQKEYKKCATIQSELTEYKEKLAAVSQPSQTEKVRVSKEDPETICRCLDILAALMMLKCVDDICPTLQTCKDQFLTPLVASNFVEVNWRVLRCLALYCILNKKIAEENAKILCIPIATYRAVTNYNKMALIVSVGAVSDLIRIYGPSIVGDDTEASTTSINTTRRRLFRMEDMDEVNLDQNKMTFDVIIEMMLEMLDDENEDLRDTAITAIGKLIFHDFPVNPTLIARIILKWYNPLIEKSAAKLQLKLGHLIDHYMKTVKGAKETIGKAVIPVIQKIVCAPKTSPLAEIDIDNVAKFLAVTTSVTNDVVNVHVTIAHDVLSKISSRPSDPIVPALTKVLVYLDISSDNANVLKELIGKTELLLEEDEVFDKSPKRNVLKFIGKLRAALSECTNNQLETIVEECSEKVDEDKSENTNNAEEIANNPNSHQNQKELLNRSVRNLNEGSEKSVETNGEALIEESDNELHQDKSKKTQVEDTPDNDQNSEKSEKTNGSLEATKKQQNSITAANSSTASPVTRQKREALKNNIKVKIPRMVEPRLLRSRDSPQKNQNSTNRVQRISSTRNNDASSISATSSVESSPKRPRINKQQNSRTPAAEKENIIINETSSEESSGESSTSSPVKRRKREALKTKVTVKISRIVEPRLLRSQDTSRTSKNSPQKNLNSTNRVQRISSTRNNNASSGSTTSSVDSYPKQPRISSENAKSATGRTNNVNTTKIVGKNTPAQRSARKTGDRKESSSESNSEQFQKENPRPTRLRTRLNYYKESSESSSFASNSQEKKKKQYITNGVIAKLPGMGRSAESTAENSPRQINRKSVSNQPNHNNKENNSDRKAATRRSENSMSTSKFSVSEISRPVAESTRNNVSLSSSSNLSNNTLKVVEGRRNMRSNNLTRISEECLPSLAIDVQTKRKKSRGKSERVSQRLSQNCGDETSNATILHTIVMEESQRVGSLMVSSDSIYSTPPRSLGRSNTVISQTSSDTDTNSSPLRKSVRKIKKKRMDDYE